MKTQKRNNQTHTRGFRTALVCVSITVVICWGAAGAWADWGADFIWYPTDDPSAVGTCIAGESTTFEGKETGDPPLGTRTQYIWKFAGCTMNGTCPHGSGAQTTTWTLSEVNPNNKVVLQIKNGNDSRSVFKTVPVTGNAFTVNILPSAGCTVLAGDGGVDDDEPNSNGIVCSSETTDDALCTEQYANSQIAALKVVPEPDYDFTGWIVNGAQVQYAGTPLFLSAMPVLAQSGEFTPTPFDGDTAECQPGCSQISFQIEKPDASGTLVDTEVINVNDDDDDGDFALSQHADKEDENGVDGGDDDLLELHVVISDPHSTIAGYLLEYDDTHLRLWTAKTKNLNVDQNSGKNEYIDPRTRELPVTQTTVYAEGILPHDTTEGSPITLLALNADKKVVAQHTVTVVVANPIFAIFGTGDTSESRVQSAADNLAIDQRSPVDAQPNGHRYRSLPPPIVPGTKAGQAVYYSIDWCAKELVCQQMAKIALSSENADVVFQGHSNFGLGLAFAKPLERIADFFNMTGVRPQVGTAYTGIPWPFVRDEAPDGPTKIFAEEIPPDEMTENYLVEMPVQGSVTRYDEKFLHEWPTDIGTDGHFTLLTAPNTNEPYHYLHKFNITTLPHLIVDAGTADLPDLKYRSLCLDMCSSGLHFLESFQHGLLFYTLKAVKAPDIPKVFIEGIVGGFPWNEIQKSLNVEENGDESMISHVYSQF